MMLLMPPASTPAAPPSMPSLSMMVTVWVRAPNLTPSGRRPPRVKTTDSVCSGCASSMTKSSKSLLVSPGSKTRESGRLTSTPGREPKSVDSPAVTRSVSTLSPTTRICNFRVSPSCAFEVDVANSTNAPARPYSPVASSSGVPVLSSILSPILVPVPSSGLAAESAILIIFGTGACPLSPNAGVDNATTKPNTTAGAIPAKKGAR